MSEQAQPGGTQGFSCSRCQQPNPQLDGPPFPTELGKQIHEKICQDCWREWFAMSIKVVNEYRLNLMSPEASSIYDGYMCEFLGLQKA